jgi:ribosome-binding protein aMBF1 (putative translation factor)
MMARKYAELRAQLSPEARARSEQATKDMIAEMALSELRRAMGFSQEGLATVMNVKQPSIAKLEQRTDMYVSSLRDHIHALGGELVLIARFADRDVKISSVSGPSTSKDAAA